MLVPVRQRLANTSSGTRAPAGEYLWQDSRRADLAHDERGPTELAEWERKLLAGTADRPGR
ncbi:hypothetical protein [Streptomyces sp. NPDC002889]|uniref:hypothetical protein n=1 Tax=Streptomyces sp. NPDC002889 TaxID=3364669 RepID=UPI0036B7BB7C